MADSYRRIVLASRPHGWPTPENFRLEEAPMPALGEGEVRVRNQYLSLDPYMRGRMNAAKSYAMPQMLNETMGGATVGEVVESRSSQFAVGETVRGMLGWAEYGVSKSEGLGKVDTRHIPLSAYLGVVGMPGMTAWYGYHKIMEPKAGETIVVSAAYYNMTPGSVPKSAILNPGMFLVARFKMQGFIISDHLNLWPEGLAALGGLVASGKLKYKETIAEGLSAAPAAFIGMLKGHNFGKQLVRV